jgi:DNA-binding transcriptional LysR family regulator
MDLHRLNVFCKVVELASFTRAGESLSISQPTVSEHIRLLEQAVGERLIDRFGRKVVATPAGQIFFQYAKDLVNLGEEALQAVKSFGGKLSGNLLLGASTIPGTYILPSIIRQFRDLHPAIYISLRISDSSEIAGSVIQGELEAGVIGTEWKDRRIRSSVITHDDLVLAVFSGHPWSKKGRVSIHKLEGEPFIIREKGSGTRTVMRRILEENGLGITKLSIAAEMGSTEAVRQSIKSHLGVSIISRHAIEEDLEIGTLTEIQIEGVSFTRPLYSISRRGRRTTPACGAFLEYLRTALGSTNE